MNVKDQISIAVKCYQEVNLSKIFIICINDMSFFLIFEAIPQTE